MEMELVNNKMLSFLYMGCGGNMLDEMAPPARQATIDQLNGDIEFWYDGTSEEFEAERWLHILFPTGISWWLDHKRFNTVVLNHFEGLYNFLERKVDRDKIAYQLKTKDVVKDGRFTFMVYDNQMVVAQIVETDAYIAIVDNPYREPPLVIDLNEVDDDQN